MRFSLYLVLLLTLYGASGARADYNESMSWFQALSSAQRLEIQQNLYWTGDYKGKIDGSFGPATSTAISSFQQNHNLSGNGILSANELANLSSESRRIRELVQYHVSLTKRQAMTRSKHQVAGPVVKKKVTYNRSPVDYRWGPRLSLNSILILP